MCVCEWKDKEMANKLPDLSYTLCQEADRLAPTLMILTYRHVGDSEVTRRIRALYTDNMIVGARLQVGVCIEGTPRAMRH